MKEEKLQHGTVRFCVAPFSAHRILSEPENSRRSALHVRLSSRYSASPAQILIRWGLQHGFAVLPKSTNPERIASNMDVCSFNLSDDDMETLDNLTTEDSLSNFSSHFLKRVAVDTSGPTLSDYAPSDLVGMCCDAAADDEAGRGAKG